MTLSKQLLILVSTLFLMIFCVNFLIGLNNMKSYLQVESKVHAQNTAISLGLSLSPYIENESDPILKKIMSAIFDTGYYKELKLVNVANKPIVTLTSDKTSDGIPDWFARFLPMHAATAESEIASGWNLGGVIYVTTNPENAHLKLFQQAKHALWISLAAFVPSIALLTLILRLTLQPLKKINQLALTIADGHFHTIDKLPWTTEVKNVAISMNTMSVKLSGIMNNLTVKMDALGNKLKIDELTGLQKKSSFESDMKQLFLENIDAFLFLIRIDSLSSLAKEQSSETIDSFLQSCASAIKNSIAIFSKEDAGAYHFYGGEFAVIVRKLNFQQVEQLSVLLSNSIAELGAPFYKSDIVHIGVAAFNPLSSTSGMLAAANEAYEQAKLIGSNSFHIRTGGNQAKDISEWKSLVFGILNKETYKISLISQTEDFKTGKLMMEEAFFQAYDSKGSLLPMGTFFSMAEKFEKSVDIDKKVIEKVIQYVNDQNVRHAVAVNLSTRAVKSNDFRNWLSTHLRNYPFLCSQLIFSTSAYAAAKEFDAYKEFIQYLHGFGAKVLLKRFDIHSMTVTMAKDLSPDYIRLSRELCNGIGSDPSKQSYIETIMEFGGLFNIEVLAENIIADSDYSVAKAIGLAGIIR